MADSITIPRKKFEELKKKAGAFDRLSEKLHKPHVMLASETSLAKDWLSEEEEEAWKDL